MANFNPFKTTKIRWIAALSLWLCLLTLTNASPMDVTRLSPPRDGIFGLRNVPDQIVATTTERARLSPPREGIFGLSHLPGADTPPQCDETTTHTKIKNTFAYLDYTVLIAMLVVSCGIGMFYGFVGKKQATSSDFLLGGGSMGTLPTAMSLAASFITAIELLGNPAEMYNYGAQFWMICVAFLLVVPLTSRLYLPVFMSLRLTSSFEYLSLRFSNSTRYLASALYILQMILYTSVAVYAPALALSHVTGLNVYIAVSMVYIVCIFYASQGGMKAVIIADSFQAAVLIGSLLAILSLGEYYLGGNGIIWSTSYNTERLEIFNIDPSPTVRHSFWSVVIGGTFYWLTMFCANQASIQKYLSVAKLSQARTALWVSAFGLIFIYTVNFYTGMIMLAHWRTCDPLKSGDIDSSDQLLPLYVINVLGHLHGMTGFFVAGIFAASLGTVASALNSLAAVTTEDFIQGLAKVKLPDSKGALLAKWISFTYGVLSFGLVFIVEQLGSIMQVALSFNGMVGGVTLGLFSLGMFFPWANSKGAMFGALVAASLVLFMGIGSQFKQASGEIVQPMKYTSAQQCECFNETEVTENIILLHDESQVFYLFRISYLWYSMIGCLTTVFLGLIVSFCTGAQDPKALNQELLSPVTRNICDKFSNDMKEFLNLPLKNAPTKKVSVSMGVVNPTLDVSDEHQMTTISERKSISADSDKTVEADNVTGLNVYIAVSMVYIVCIFYASQGGMKAVIIADSFQAAVLIGSLLAILSWGEYYLGGNGIIWSTSYSTERLEIFNIDPSPTVRHSFWSVVIGGTFYWLTMFCANQASIQKYLSVAKLSQARTADTNGDDQLDTNELAKWINLKIKQHIAKAIHNNYGLFTIVDVNPRNGVVTWEEYHAYFLKQKGLSNHYVKNHDEKKHVGLQRSLKEQIMRDKAYWREAARFDPDSLTLDEFLTFTHPESSASNQLALVDELYEKFDRDGDDFLTEDEFATTTVNDGTSPLIYHQSETERRKEFQTSIDLNHDGKADRRELLRYVAPQNPRRSELEAQTLISLADIDHSDTLNLSEVLARPDLFMASKMVDTGRSFHDEF